MGDATTLPIILTAITTAALAVAGMYAFVLRRESGIRDEARSVHDKQELRIEKVECEAKKMKDNNFRQFREVNDNVHAIRSEIIEAMHILETNLRESHHTLADNVSKALARLETIVGGMQHEKSS